MKPKKGFSVQIKPVGASCNIDCTYCYVAPFRSSHFSIMSDEVLEKIVNSALSFQESLCFSWHGGEPTLAGIRFFGKAMELITKYKHSNQFISNLIQTNATTITTEFAKFFKKNEFFVGVSLDGPKFIHDEYRVKKNGQGTFDDVMRGIRILQQEDVNLAATITVSKSALPYCKEVFDFR
jgi:uncharacterized protein